MKIVFLKLKVAYLRLWCRYYSKQYHKYFFQESLYRLIMRADSSRYSENYETSKELHEYYHKKVSDYNSRIFHEICKLDVLGY